VRRPVADPNVRGKRFRPKLDSAAMTNPSVMLSTPREAVIQSRGLQQSVSHAAGPTNPMSG
jgi:hypothetical protein